MQLATLEKNTNLIILGNSGSAAWWQQPCLIHIRIMLHRPYRLPMDDDNGHPQLQPFPMIMTPSWFRALEVNFANVF